MPAEPISLPLIATVVVAAGFPVLATTQAAQASGPGHGDIYAVLGAAAASILVLLEGDGKNRRQLAALFLSSVACGAFIPGLAVQIAFWRGWIEANSVLSWNVWAIAGFFFGLMGWGIIHYAMAVGTRLLAKHSEKFLK